MALAAGWEVRVRTVASVTSYEDPGDVWHSVSYTWTSSWAVMYDNTGSTSVNGSFTLVPTDSYLYGPPDQSDITSYLTSIAVYLWHSADLSAYIEIQDYNPSDGGSDYDWHFYSFSGTMGGNG